MLSCLLSHNNTELLSRKKFSDSSAKALEARGPGTSTWSRGQGAEGQGVGLKGPVKLLSALLPRDINHKTGELLGESRPKSWKQRHPQLPWVWTKPWASQAAVHEPVLSELGYCREGIIVERRDLKSPEALSLFTILFVWVFCKFNIFKKTFFFKIQRKYCKLVNRM